MNLKTIKVAWSYLPLALLASLTFCSTTAFAQVSISALTATNMQNTSAEISWKTSRKASSRVEYSLDSSLASAQVAYDGNLLLNHRMVLSNLTAGTKYYYRVSSKDSRGVVAYSGIQSFSTLGTTATPEPFAISAVSVGQIQATSAQITFLSNRPATGKVIYSTNSLLPADSLILYDGTLLTNHIFNLAGLQPATIYYYRVSSADVNGAYGESAILSFKTAGTVVSAGNVIPMSSAEWMTAYDGYGFVSFDVLTGSVVFAPLSPDPNGPLVDISNTHAVMLLANRYLAQPIRNLRITVDVTTEQQLRTPTPNAWEVFWLFFNYTTDSNGKKKANYFTVKPNGAELGTAFDEVGQKFLFTSASPVLTIGKRNVLVIEKIDLNVKAYMDGVLIMDYNNSGAVDPLYNIAGTIGLYCEDARVRVHSVKVDPL